MFELKADIWGKALWRMLYEACARAEEILTFNIEDCPPGPSTRNGLRKSPTRSESAPRKYVRASSSGSPAEPWGWEDLA